MLERPKEFNVTWGDATAALMGPGGNDFMLYGEIHRNCFALLNLLTSLDLVILLFTQSNAKLWVVRYTGRIGTKK